MPMHTAIRDSPSAAATTRPIVKLTDVLTMEAMIDAVAAEKLPVLRVSTPHGSTPRARA
jgi:hypothetical protein